jgi:hypothetical protein
MRKNNYKDDIAKGRWVLSGTIDSLALFSSLLDLYL